MTVITVKSHDDPKQEMKLILWYPKIVAPGAYLTDVPHEDQWKVAAYWQLAGIKRGSRVIDPECHTSPAPPGAFVFEVADLVSDAGYPPGPYVLALLRKVGVVPAPEGPGF